MFTTRADTLFGATFMSLAPEHPLTLSLAQGTGQEEAVGNFVEYWRAQNRSRGALEEVTKEGVFTGSFCVNPVTGRHMPIEILPFDFREILKARQYEVSADKFLLPDEKAKLLGYLTQYMTNGGYPEIVTKDVEPRGYLDVLFDAVLFKDVIKRHKVRFSKQIDNLGSYLINNVSNPYTARKLASVLAFKSDVTVAKYLGYLTEAYLIFSLLRYSPKSLERIKSPRKVYAVDNGFVSAKAIQHSLDKGKLMENLVFTELVKRGIKPNRELFYYKTRNNREVDFVVKKGLEVTELMQVCYDLTNPDVEQRETKALFEASEELKVKKLTVFTWDEKREIKKDGNVILLIPLWEWLLEKAQD